MSRFRCARISLKGIPAAVRGICAGPVCVVPRRNFFHASDATRNLSSDAGDGGGEEEENEGGGKSRVPLDPTWVEMARKQLKGADPAEKLTWRTAEVSLAV